MKKGTGKITAKGVVNKVQNFVKLTEKQIEEVLQANQDKLNLSKKQQDRWRKKCICLIEFTDMNEIEALDFNHQGHMDDWLIIEKIEDVVIGTSIPFNYEQSKF